MPISEAKRPRSRRRRRGGVSDLDARTANPSGPPPRVRRAARALAAE
jgi:hypothetical protein